MDSILRIEMFWLSYATVACLLNIATVVFQLIVSVQLRSVWHWLESFVNVGQTVQPISTEVSSCSKLGGEARFTKV